MFTGATEHAGHEEKRNEERENLGVFWYENPK